MLSAQWQPAPYGNMQKNAVFASVPALEKKEEKGTSAPSFVRPFPPVVQTGVPTKLVDMQSTLARHDWYRFNRQKLKHELSAEEDNYFVFDGRHRQWSAQAHTSYLGDMSYMRNPKMKWACTHRVGESCTCPCEKKEKL